MGAKRIRRYFSLSGRVSRLGYFVLLVFPAVMVMFAAEYADQVNCLNAPLLQETRNSIDVTEAETKLPSGVISVIRRQMRKDCKNSWLIQINKESAGKYSANFNFGFEWLKENKYFSGTPFQSLAILLLIWPFLVLTSKRIHDVGKSTRKLLYPIGMGIIFIATAFLSGWLFLLLAGLLILLVTFLTTMVVSLLWKGQVGANHFGPDPLGGVA